MKGLYNIAKDCRDYIEFVTICIHGVFKNDDKTPDGADWGEADLDRNE